MTPLWYRHWKAIDHSDRQFRDRTSAISNSLDAGLETGLACCLILGRTDLPFVRCDPTEPPEHERLGDDLGCVLAVNRVEFVS